MALKDHPEKLRPFFFHGVSLDYSGDEARGDCPFCDKPGHFFVKVSTGQFSCRRCQTEGNIPSFMSQLWDMAKGMESNEDRLAELAEERGLTVEGLQAFNFVAHPIIGGNFAIMAHNPKGAAANLNKVAKVEGKWRIMGTPTCKVHPFGTHLLNKNHQTVAVTEGPWDGVAMWEMFRGVAKNGDRFVKTKNPAATMATSHGVLSAPGAGTFNAEWLSYLQGKDAWLLFDNDHPAKNPATGKWYQPGWDGMARVVRLMSDPGPCPNTVRRIRWGSGEVAKKVFVFDPARKSGYDMRDFKNEYGHTKAMEHITGLLETVDVSPKDGGEAGEDKAPPIEPIHRSSFAALCEDWSSVLHFTPVLRDTLAITLATVISTTLRGEQLWLRIIGPPGSGKSTVAEAISAAKEHVWAKSIVTGFHSGYVIPGKGKAKDASLIPMMNGKTVVVKDGDTLLSAPNLPKILGELRDIYDGTSRSQYRNREGKDYEGLRITFLLCGTDELRSLNRSFLGDRFLDCEILGDGSANQVYLTRAVANAKNIFASNFGPKTEKEAHGQGEMFIKQTTVGFLLHLKNTLAELSPPIFTAEMDDRFEALAQWVSFMRARINRDGESLLYRPRPELATRLGGQFVKMAGCLGIVLGKPTIDEEVYSMVRKVAMDTAEGFHYEVARLLFKYPNGLGAKQLALELNLSETSIRRYVEDMRELHIIHRKSVANKSGVRGRDAHLLVLSDTVRRLWKKAITGDKT